MRIARTAAEDVDGGRVRSESAGAVVPGGASSGSTRVVCFSRTRPIPKIRTHLTVRMSYDECRTWPVSKVLHEGLASYSDLAVADGHILCFHEVDQGGRMILARFAPGWLES